MRQKDCIKPSVFTYLPLLSRFNRQKLTRRYTTMVSEFQNPICEEEMFFSSQTDFWIYLKWEGPVSKDCLEVLLHDLLPEIFCITWLSRSNCSGFTFSSCLKLLYYGCSLSSWVPDIFFDPHNDRWLPFTAWFLIGILLNVWFHYVKCHFVNNLLRTFIPHQKTLLVKN